LFITNQGRRHALPDKVYVILRPRKWWLLHKWLAQKERTRAFELSSNSPLIEGQRKEYFVTGEIDRASELYRCLVVDTVGQVWRTKKNFGRRFAALERMRPLRHERLGHPSQPGFADIKLFCAGTRYRIQVQHRKQPKYYLYLREYGESEAAATAFEEVVAEAKKYLEIGRDVHLEPKGGSSGSGRTIFELL
jgi:hypothetical protein